MRAEKLKLFFMLCVCVLIFNACSAQEDTVDVEPPTLEQNAESEEPETIEPATELEGELQPENTAKAYLSNWAYSSYMYEDRNLDALTVLSEDIDGDALTLAVSEILESGDTPENFCTAVFGAETETAAATGRMRGNMQFMKDKAAYFSEIRQLNGMERENFSTEYSITHSDIGESFAVIEAVENISFQYAGAAEPSYGQQEHTVFLIRLGDEWFVANVDTANDWFNSQYKNTDYDIDAIIAAEKQNIEAQQSHD